MLFVRRLVVSCWVFAALAPVPLVAQEQPVAPDEIGLDVVIALDTSRSMERINRPDGGQTTFRELINWLGRFVIYELPDEAHLVILAFDRDVRVVHDAPLNLPELRQKAWLALAQLRPEGDSTWLAKGFQESLRQISALKEKHPRHERLLVLISDARDNPPEGVRPLTFGEIARQAQEEWGLIPGEDFELWYLHIGDPEEQLVRVVRGWGRARLIPLDARIPLHVVKLNTCLVRADVLPGTRKIELPPPADRQKGAVLRLEGPPGTALKLRLVGEPAVQEKVVLLNEEVELRSRKQELVLPLELRDLPPGKYQMRLALEPNRRLIVVHPRALTIELTVPEPVVRVLPDTLNLGVIQPGAAVEGALHILPNDTAEALAPEVRLQPGSVTRGLALELDPQVATVEQETVIRVRAIGLKEGRVEFGPGMTTVRLTTQTPHLRIRPEQVTVGYVLEPLRVAFRRTQFEKVLAPGETAVQVELEVAPDLLKPLGHLAVQLAVVAPAGGKARVEPGVVVFTPGEPTKTITVHFPEQELLQPGSHRVSLSATTDNPLCHIETAQLQLVVVRERAPVVVRLTKPTIDLVPFQAAQQVRVPLQVPREARPFQVRMEPVSEPGPEAPKVELAPAEFAIEPDTAQLTFNVRVVSERPTIGRWTYRFRVVPQAPDVAVDPAFIELVLDIPVERVELPPALPSGAVSWPFRFRVALPAQVYDGLNAPLRFRYRLGEGEWIDGGVEPDPVREGQRVLVTVSGGDSFLNPITADGNSLTLECRLEAADQLLREWAVPGIAVRSCPVQGVSLLARAGGTMQVLGSDRWELTEPVELIVRANQVSPAKAVELEAVCYVREVAAGQESAVSPNDSGLLRAAYEGKSPELKVQQTSPGGLIDGVVLDRLDPPPGSFVFGRGEKEWVVMAAVVGKDAGNVRWWSPVVVARVYAPARRPYGIWLIGVTVCLLAGLVGWQCWTRNRLPRFTPLVQADPSSVRAQPGCLQVQLLNPDGRLVFRPSGAQPYMAKIEERTGLLEWLLGRRSAVVTVWPRDEELSPAQITLLVRNGRLQVSCTQPFTVDDVPYEAREIATVGDLNGSDTEQVSVHEDVLSITWDAGDDGSPMQLRYEIRLGWCPPLSKRESEAGTVGRWQVEPTPGATDSHEADRTVPPLESEGDDLPL